MAVGWGDEDPARLDGLAVARVRRREASGAGKDGRQVARGIRREMEDDEHRGPEVAWQPTDEADEGLDPARRRADDHEVPVWHAPLLSVRATSGTPTAGGASNLRRRAARPGGLP